LLAIGNEAKRMIGRTPNNILAVRPIKDGVIADFEMTAKMLRYFITKIYKRKKLVSPRIVISIPSGITKVEKKSVIDVVLEAKAREIYLIEEPVAAAIGANLPVNEPTASMVIDIGGGTTDIAVISLGGIVTSNSIRVAGDEMNEAIISYLKNSYNILIGENRAEEIKMNFGSACFPNSSQITEVTKVVVRGVDLIDGLPKVIEIDCKEIQDALKNTVKQIIVGVKDVLSEVPAELSGDIMDKGIIMAGGGSLLKGLDYLLSQELGVPVYLDDNPLDCIALGAGKVLESLDKFESFLVGSKFN
jgi:rod shape-determining protein MreB